MAHIAKYQSGALGNMCAHYDRWGGDLSKAAARDNIDPEKTHLNYNLAPERRNGQVAFVRDRIDALDLKRAPRKDAVKMCDCILTKPQSLHPAYTTAFFKKAYNFLANRYGAENVISAWVHMDEPNAQPHMHFAWVPVTKDGRLSAKEVVNRLDLQTLHADMQEYIERELGRSVEILLGDEKQQEKALSNVPQNQLDAARAGLEALEAQKEALTAEIASETARLDRLRQRARGIGEEVDAMAAAAAKIEQLDNASRREYGAICREITAGCNSAEETINRGIERIRERIDAIRQRIREIRQKAIQSFSLDTRKRQAQEVSQVIYQQHHSRGRNAGIER